MEWFLLHKFGVCSLFTVQFTMHINSYQKISNQNLMCLLKGCINSNRFLFSTHWYDAKNAYSKTWRCFLYLWISSFKNCTFSKSLSFSVSLVAENLKEFRDGHSKRCGLFYSYIFFIQVFFKYNNSYHRRSWHRYKLAWCNYWVSRHLLHRWPKCNIFKFWMDSSGKMRYWDTWYQHSVSSIFESQPMNVWQAVNTK